MGKKALIFFLASIMCFILFTPAAMGHAGDTSPPELVKATVYKHIMTLQYNEPLRARPTQEKNSYTVKVNEKEQTPQRVFVVFKTVILIFPVQINPGDRVTVSYHPGKKELRDLAGNRAATFTDLEVINKSPENDPPSLTEAIAGEPGIELIYDEPLLSNKFSIPPTGAFKININGKLTIPQSISIDNTVVTLKLKTPLKAGDKITISYKSHPLRALCDLSGNKAPGFSNIRVKIPQVVGKNYLIANMRK